MLGRRPDRVDEGPLRAGVRRIGLAPDCGASYFVVRMLGYSKAFQWLGTARELDAREALAWGVADEVVEPDRLLSRAVEVARSFAALPATAIGKTKWLLEQAMHHGLAEQLELEDAVTRVTGPSEDAEAARRAMVERLSRARASRPGG